LEEHSVSLLPNFGVNAIGALAVPHAQLTASVSIARRTRVNGVTRTGISNSHPSSGLLPFLDGLAERLADLGGKERGQRCRRNVTGVETVGRVKAVPKTD
jgi:hypothetical protein